jgi:hypothetical protein
MVELRRPWSERLHWVLIWAVIIALGGATAWLFTDSLTAPAECRAAYARAKTALDSTIVDQTIPITRRTDGMQRVSCGVLRQTGKL